MRLHRADLWLGEDIRIGVTDLRATLVPSAADAPVRLDTPTHFGISIHQGRVTLDSATLQTLIQHYFAGGDRGMRDVQVAIAHDRLVITGQFQRRGWVDFHLTGSVQRADGRHLALIPQTLSVNGQPARAVMAASNIRLADVVSVRGPAIRIDGNRILLDVLALLPPPTITAMLATATLDARGLHLTFDDGHHEPQVEPARTSRSYGLLYGGRLIIGPLHLADPRIQLVAADNDRLDLSLNHYRQQLDGQPMRLLPDVPHTTFLVPLAPWQSS
ncbi:hypothetical protein [Salinisphaera sp. Q1T1-3]|uniref:hypothetical protein n=1 Tax=Salinisphaera sp. Q1T1-3 TaxID=2321229 RepID=UPI0011C37243|nr:hypothetical protein [Salinisphaera sp. Q1T1-3]